jgi:hypothetical protein
VQELSLKVAVDPLYYLKDLILQYIFNKKYATTIKIESFANRPTAEAVKNDKVIIAGNVFLWRKINKNLYLNSIQSSKNESMFPIIINEITHFR